MSVRMGRRGAMVALGLGVLSTVAAVPARAAAWPSVLGGRAPSLHPEGVCWDPTRHTFLVGSMRHGTVSVVRRDGSVRTLVDDGVMVSTIGVRVDAARRRVLAAYQDLGVGTKSSEATKNRQSGVGVFDLATGALRHRVDLSAVPGAAPGAHGTNDVAVDAHGNAYVTDVSAGEIYRVDPHGRASVLVSRPDLLGKDGVGPNGIVWHPAGFLLAIRYDRGELVRVPIRAPHRARVVRTDEAFVGGDGLALRPDGSLVVACNHVACATTSRVSVLRSFDGWASARAVARSGVWPDENPSTVAVTPHGTYVVEGRIADLFAGKYRDTFTLRRL
ncbi:SMP-30/gluconolactonase/LRE family protein [Amycolatopsis anabasis]|uniref:SMP-30/gluconolactonase/LRE family protein n=1 Tax=Amycolatopsis anabasis TaxID=1840409 RepID=UPI00131E78DC|nr:SMP-30/gluconolactonase/LRE family protein [Amycolatopsis anabasis]